MSPLCIFPHLVSFYFPFLFFLCLVDSTIITLIENQNPETPLNQISNSMNVLTDLTNKKNTQPAAKKTTTRHPEPSGPPQDVKCHSPSSTSVLVSWRPPPVELQNGIITQYSVHYAETEGEDTPSRQIPSIPAESSEYLLENLEKWTEYRVTVVAHTDVGAGPESLPQLVRTEEDGMCSLKTKPPQLKTPLNLPRQILTTFACIYNSLFSTLLYLLLTVAT